MSPLRDKIETAVCYALLVGAAGCAYFYDPFGRALAAFLGFTFFAAFALAGMFVILWAIPFIGERRFRLIGLGALALLAAAFVVIAHPFSFAAVINSITRHFSG